MRIRKWKGQEEDNEGRLKCEKEGKRWDERLSRSGRTALMIERKNRTEEGN